MHNRYCAKGCFVMTHVSWSAGCDHHATNCKHGFVRRARRRRIHFALSSSKMCEAEIWQGTSVNLSSFAAAGSVALLFPPLGSSAAEFIGSLEFAAAAASAGLIVLCVDRPGIGGTSASPRRWFRCAQTRLACHSADVIAVLNALGLSNSRVHLVGMCAGANFALGFSHAHPDHCDPHLTLVTPWVSGECPHNNKIVRQAAAGMFGPHATIGPILLLLSVPRLHRFLSAKSDLAAVKAATVAFSSSERALLSRRTHMIRATRTHPTH